MKSFKLSLWFYGFMPPLCTYRIHWARRTSWWWWDEWDDTSLQTKDSKFDPWWSEVISRSWRLLTILNLHEWAGQEHYVCVFETWRPEWGSNPRSPTFQAGRFTHCTRAPALEIWRGKRKKIVIYQYWLTKKQLKDHVSTESYKNEQWWKYHGYLWFQQKMSRKSSFKWKKILVDVGAWQGWCAGCRTWLI